MGSGPFEEQPTLPMSCYFRRAVGVSICMWSAIANFFAGGPDDSSTRHDSQVSLDELTALRAQISSLQLQLEASKKTLLSIAKQEDTMVRQQCALVLECHDGYLHPQLDDNSAPHDIAVLSADWVHEQRTLAAEAADEVGVPDHSEVWLSVASGDGVVPHFGSEENSPEDKARIRASLVRNGKTLAESLPKVLDSLREKRHSTDDFIFELECRLATLESQERQASLRVGELAYNQLGGSSRSYRGSDGDGGVIEIVSTDPASPERTSVQPESC